MMNSIELFSAPETLPPVSHVTIGMGADKARAYLEHLLRNEKAKGEKKAFGPGILKALHRQVLFYYPNLAGHFRPDDDIRIAGRKPVPATELEDKVYLFERWLEDEVDQLRQDPEDLAGAIRVATAAHYGVVADLHPFPDGNGRVARVLMNGILMLNTLEGKFYGRYILPVPILRERIDVEELKKVLISGKEPKLTPYLKVLEDINNTWTLNLFEIFIAGKWIQSIDGFLNESRLKYESGGNGKKNGLGKNEHGIIEKMKERRGRLQQFVETGMEGKLSQDRVPDFFAARRLGS